MSPSQTDRVMPTRISVEPKDAGFEAYGELLRAGDVYVRLDGVIQRGVITADSVAGFVEIYDMTIDLEDVDNLPDEWPTVIRRGVVTITLRENPATVQSRRATLFRLKANAGGPSA